MTQTVSWTSSTVADVQWPVRTERLTIRPAVRSDIEALWRFYRIPAVSQWTSWDASDRDSYQAMFEELSRLAKTLVVELDGHVIGDVRLTVEDAWAQAEVADQAKGTQAVLGWCFNPAHSGNGYATEAVRAVIGIGFQHLGLRRLTAHCLAPNVRSWRLMERVGMRRESYTVRDGLHRSGEWVDGATYGLLYDEWAD